MYTDLDCEIKRVGLYTFLKVILEYILLSFVVNCYLVQFQERLHIIELHIYTNKRVDSSICVSPSHISSPFNVCN